MHAFRTLSLAVVAAGSAAAGHATVPAAAGDLRTLLQRGPVTGAADWRLSPEQRAQLRRQLSEAQRSNATTR